MVKINNGSMNLNEVEVKSMQESLLNFDVLVLGAGAAGLMCALTAAQRGRRVLVLEKSNKAGKKILMSGGGRCNFSNHIVEPEHFISANAHFCKSALNRYTQWDFIAMVERHGIEYEERKHGQLFCRHSAKDILAMLLKECDGAGVQIYTSCDIRQINDLSLTEQGDQEPNKLTRKAPENYFEVQFNHGQRRLCVECEALVVATGALSIPSLGGSGVGYDIADQFGLAITKRQAGLVPFMFSDAIKLLCERLSGLSVEVEVSCNGQSFLENMLFTHRGVSGPAILQISNYWHPGEEVKINLMPHIDAAEWLTETKHHQGKSLLKTQLNKVLSKGLVNELQMLWWAESANTPLAEFSDKLLRDIGKNINQWCLRPSATEGYRTAEVTLGGVDTKGISSKTMEAKQQPGLYFIGEVLDVTGHLGGFNFQWAWTSGYSAGSYV